MGKVLHGLDMFHLALLTKDDHEGVTYEPPEPVPGAVNVSVTPNTESNTFFADNGAYEIFNSLGDIDVNMEVADLPLEMQKKIYGHQEEEGVQFASIEDTVAELALSFRAKVSTGGYRYYWFLKGKAQLLPNEYQTDEGNVTPQTAKLTLKFMPLQYNKRWKSQAEDKPDLNLGEKWFKEVVYKGDVLTPTP
ncbi:major tail protein [Virgibacillus pantothenticus]|uniref:Major tail protein n=1 Tax=Virgibacillus pantothenticus TaxID=1473 RepID=A0A0L0QM83_VIRPA|nr:major tail protein [Virgibacillus pantothenticus]KNE19671.1 major tail protein [Virgibacillus pantothenticus]MED3736623.1 phage tail protein [Virgibacillus pantothenticus]QTY14800.1 phage tail protein [Virgibacillus pantothenticus]SIS79605.1 phage major tail protein, phi13 family [Virgibacillus pantothenticus]